MEAQGLRVQMGMLLDTERRGDVDERVLAHPDRRVTVKLGMGGTELRQHGDILGSKYKMDPTSLPMSSFHPWSVPESLGSHRGQGDP